MQRTGDDSKLRDTFPEVLQVRVCCLFILRVIQGPLVHGLNFNRGFEEDRDSRINEKVYIKGL